MNDKMNTQESISGRENGTGKIWEMAQSVISLKTRKIKTAFRKRRNNWY